MGVMLSLGVTLAAGIAVWGFARNQAGVQEQQLGTAFNGNVNALNEQFVVAQVVYAASSITIYIYNSGQSPVHHSHREQRDGGYFQFHYSIVLKGSLQQKSFSLPKELLN